MGTLMDILKSLPALRKQRNPTAAAIWGFLLGGIGLGLYFGSLLDFVFPILAAIIIGAVLKTTGWIVGAALVGIYGYVRASSSNAKIAEAKKVADEAHG